MSFGVRVKRQYISRSGYKKLLNKLNSRNIKRLAAAGAVIRWFEKCFEAAREMRSSRRKCGIISYNIYIYIILALEWYILQYYNYCVYNSLDDCTAAFVIHYIKGVSLYVCTHTGVSGRARNPRTDRRGLFNINT